MRILLIQPGEGEMLGVRNLVLVEPLGLETLAGELTKHEVRLLDMRLEDGLSETVKQFRPDLCGITCSYTIDVYRALEIAAAVKSSGDGCRPFVVVGGHHATLSPTDFNTRSVDAIVLGEGERTLAELVACLDGTGDLEAVPGLVINSAQGQVRTRIRPLVEDLDSLPFPARHLTYRHRDHYYFFGQRPLAAVETARGCPYRCSFCTVWQFYQGGYRTKSAQRVVDEVTMIHEKYVLFSDDNFLADSERAEQIAISLLDRGIRHRYFFQARTDSIAAHPDLVKLWRQVGLHGVIVGLEKTDDTGLAGINKHNSAPNNERALEILLQHGVATIGSFIVDPTWEREDFEALRQYVRSHHIDAPSFSVLTPFPGTVLYRKLRNRLQTRNYELFDLLHAVLPTLLPLPVFYEELAALYGAAYPQEKVESGAVRLLRRELSLHSFGYIERAARVAKMLASAEFYLDGHRMPKTYLTEKSPLNSSPE